MASGFRIRYCIFHTRRISVGDGRKDDGMQQVLSFPLCKLHCLEILTWTQEDAFSHFKMSNILIELGAQNSEISKTPDSN